MQLPHEHTQTLSSISSSPLLFPTGACLRVQPPPLGVAPGSRVTKWACECSVAWLTFARSSLPPLRALGWCWWTRYLDILGLAKTQLWKMSKDEKARFWRFRNAITGVEFKTWGEEEERRGEEGVSLWFLCTQAAKLYVTVLTSFLCFHSVPSFIRNETSRVEDIVQAWRCKGDKEDGKKSRGWTARKRTLTHNSGCILMSIHIWISMHKKRKTYYTTKTTKKEFWVTSKEEYWRTNMYTSVAKLKDNLIDLSAKIHYHLRTDCTNNLSKFKKQTTIKIFISQWISLTAIPGSRRLWFFSMFSDFNIG